MVLAAHHGGEQQQRPRFEMDLVMQASRHPARRRGSLATRPRGDAGIGPRNRPASASRKPSIAPAPPDSHATRSGRRQSTAGNASRRPEKARAQGDVQALLSGRASWGGPCEGRRGRFWPILAGKVATDAVAAGQDVFGRLLTRTAVFCPRTARMERTARGRVDDRRRHARNAAGWQRSRAPGRSRPAVPHTAKQLARTAHLSCRGTVKEITNEPQGLPRRDSPAGCC